MDSKVSKADSRDLKVASGEHMAIKKKSNVDES